MDIIGVFVIKGLGYSGDWGKELHCLDRRSIRKLAKEYSPPEVKEVASEINTEPLKK